MKQIPFIDLFKTSLHVSGDKLVHAQEHFLTVYTAFGAMCRYCCRPVTKVRWNSSISTLSQVGSNIGVLYQKLYIHSKSAPEDGGVCRPKHVELLEKKKISKRNTLHIPNV